jgi:anti-sigma28 factor (negative regulator of flagellin synthesis)
MRWLEVADVQESALKPKQPEQRFPVEIESISDSEWDRALEDPDSIAALYSPEYLRQCSGPAERLERIAELKRRIEAQAYRIDCDRIAEELLARGDLSD